jgi:transposase InsO family protein
MPWKEHRKMSLKMEFVEKASRPGARISELCREYGISRECGYKWLNRFKREGYDGLEERTRAPHSSPLMKAEELVQGVLAARESHPRWGPKKLYVVVKRRFGEEVPSQSTIARILRRFGQVKARRARRPLSSVERAPEVVADAPNDAWTVDFKGWWRSLDGCRCEPLTVRDKFSRYILAVEPLESTAEAGVREVFEGLFRKYGLPKAMQCDNGTPFIAVRGRGGLTRLSAWWISLGIRIVRSRPASPQDNGGHERMHVDLSGDVQAFPAATRELQKRVLSKWRKEFNDVRPHEALGGKVPAEVYEPSPRRRLDLPAFKYPDHWLKRNVVGKDGVFTLEGQVYQAGRAFSGQVIALEPLGGLQHRMWFREIDLGPVELAPPRRMIDSAVEALLERPFRKSHRVKRPRSDSANQPEALPSPSAGTSQLASLPQRPPQRPNEPCSQQTLGSSAVSSAATEVQPA